MAVGFSAALAAMTWALPTIPAVAVTYGAMLAAQSSGGLIIKAFHNDSAAAAAAARPCDVAHNLSLDALCAGYEAHHWDSASNCLHAAGMLLCIGFCVLLVTCRPTIGTSLRVAIALPPTWYLFAWIGHFWFQADIPAVFTYGMTFRGWAVGEYCSIRALFEGRTVGTSGPNASVGREELILTSSLVLVYGVAALPAWRTAVSGSKLKVG